MTTHSADYTIGQTSLTWTLVDLTETPRNTYFPDAIDAARSEVVRAMEATYERPTRKPRPGKLQTLDARGRKALAQEDETLTEEDRASAKYLIRVYYLSFGGEVLAFDVAAHSAARRDAIERDVGYSDAVAWRVYDRSRSVQTVKTWGKERRDSVLNTARVVTLPSQSTEPVQVVDLEGDAARVASAARLLWAVASPASAPVRTAPSIPAVLPAIPAPPVHAFTRAA